MVALERLKKAKDNAMEQLKNLEKKGYSSSSPRSGSASSTPETQHKDDVERINQIVDNRIVSFQKMTKKRLTAFFF